MSANEANDSTLDPDEPHTPWWFPLLGLALFLIGGIFLLATDDEEAAEEAGAEDAAGEKANAEPDAQPAE